MFQQHGSSDVVSGCKQDVVVKGCALQLVVTEKGIPNGNSANGFLPQGGNSG